MFVTFAYIPFLIHLLAFLAASEIGLEDFAVFFFCDSTSFGQKRMHCLGTLLRCLCFLDENVSFQNVGDKVNFV